MSIESRIRQLERRQALQDDHIHWIPLDGSEPQTPKNCQECIEADGKLHFITLVNLRTQKPIELSHVR